jgi:hypothetical protein
MKTIEIPLSKTKIFLILVLAIVFVILGILFTITPETFISTVFRNPQTIRLGGIASVLFCGSGVIYGIRKMFDKRIGLKIDENGITDNTNAVSVGLINWTDITEIKTEQVRSTKFLLIFTSNPDKYLDRVGALQRKIMKANMFMYGTPLSISSNTLKYNFVDLEKMIVKYHKDQNKKMYNR